MMMQQEHKSSGDNVGGDKIIHQNITWKPLLIILGLILLAVITYYSIQNIFVTEQPKNLALKSYDIGLTPFFINNSLNSNDVNGYNAYKAKFLTDITDFDINTDGFILETEEDFQNTIIQVLPLIKDVNIKYFYIVRLSYNIYVAANFINTEGDFDFDSAIYYSLSKLKLDEQKERIIQLNSQYEFPIESIQQKKEYIARLLAWAEDLKVDIEKIDL